MRFAIHVWVILQYNLRKSGAGFLITFLQPSHCYKKASEKQKSSIVKLQIFSYLSVNTYVVGIQKNSLSDTVLLSTHNIRF